MTLNRKLSAHAPHIDVLGEEEGVLREALRKITGALQESRIPVHGESKRERESDKKVVLIEKGGGSRYRRH